MKWDEKDGEDKRVTSIGWWCDVRNIKKVFPKTPGIYVFVDSNYHVKFIGNSKEDELSAAAQDAVYRGEDYGATRATWLITGRRDSTQELHRSLIKKYLSQKRINHSSGGN